MTEKTIDQEIAEAAELEGLAPMPAELEGLRLEKLEIDKQKALLEQRLTEIKDEFGKRLEADGLQGYVVDGKVHARVSHGTRTGVDAKKLKAEMPHIWSKYLKTTAYRSVTIS